MEKRIVRILQNCRNLRELKETHVQILANGLGESNLILPKLIDLSSAFKSLDYATQIFGHCMNPNVVVFNTMMKCLIEKNHQDEAFLIYSRMRVLGTLPNNFTFTILLKGCESVESLEGSSGIHAQIIKCGFGFDVFVQNTLLSVYSSCGEGLGLARNVFDEMLERDVVSWNSLVGAYMARGDADQAMCLFELMPERNLVSWNTLISALCKAGDMGLARSIFDRMPKKDTISWNALISGYVNCNDIVAARSVLDQMGERDVVSWTAMISGYTKIGDMKSARQLFDEMPVKNAITWNAMISGYNQNGQFDNALSMFRLMLLHGIFPDEATLVSVVSACAQLGSLEHGNWVHSYTKKHNVILTMPIGNALIDMFSKCGDIKNAEMVFSQMNKKCVITWTAMISGLAFNGQCREALALFERMCSAGVEPDDVIFITVLSACSHGGLVKEGQDIFNQMVKHYRIKPRMEHYNCMVDLLGRAGKWEEAIEFIGNIPLEPTAVIWATLLSFCSAQAPIKFVELLSQRIADLDPSNPGYRVLISNLSANKSRWDGVMEVRGMMQRDGIEKMPGCSSIQMGREVHEFLVKDSKHERRKEIYETLDGLTNLMRKLDFEWDCF